MDKDYKEVNHYQLAASQQRRKAEKDTQYNDRSKKRLSNIISTKMKTSFIGAISACEKHFGFLWGHDKNDEDLSENERAMKEIWEDIRAQILDNGNNQLRAVINEMGNYSIHWDRYSLDFPIQLTQENKENE
tara:strand:- start:78 stop:473 length:396 start_codon:yes stop_codon:yes gene_type:complete